VLINNRTKALKLTNTTTNLAAGRMKLHMETTSRRSMRIMTMTTDNQITGLGSTLHKIETSSRIATLPPTSSFSGLPMVA